MLLKKSFLKFELEKKKKEEKHTKIKQKLEKINLSRSKYEFILPNLILSNCSFSNEKSNLEKYNVKRIVQCIDREVKKKFKKKIKKN
jgi:hypothetical protein